MRKARGRIAATLSRSLSDVSFCEEDGLGQVAKLLVLVQSALDPRFWVGKVRQEDVDECVGEVGLEVTVQEQQGRRLKHEKGEGEVKRDDMRMQTTFHVLEPCVCVTRMKMCEVRVGFDNNCVSGTPIRFLLLNKRNLPHPWTLRIVQNMAGSIGTSAFLHAISWCPRTPCAQKCACNR